MVFVDLESSTTLSSLLVARAPMVVHVAMVHERNLGCLWLILVVLAQRLARVQRGGKT